MDRPVEAKRKFTAKGRQISLGECEFVFKRLWKATVETCNAKHDHNESSDHVHSSNTRFPNDIMISDLHHIIELTGMLLNKEDPTDDCEKPFDEFTRYSHRHILKDKGEEVLFESVSSELMPMVLYAIFVG